MRCTPSSKLILPTAVFCGGFLLYWATLAPSVVFGDPSEYTLVPHIWGIVHPPGYAFMTLLVRFWQTIVPIGTIAYRTNLLSATTAAGIGVAVYLAVQLLLSNLRSLISNHQLQISSIQSSIFPALPALLAATVLLVSADFWQHAIHTNAHIVTTAFAAASLLALLRWRTTEDDRWLFGFGLLTGLGVTQHPLTVFGFPAYTAFIISVRPRILNDWRTLAKLVLAALLGLTPWLYFPIRAALQPAPAFGPADMNTLDGFLNLALARGLHVNLFAFGFQDQIHRLVVFWSLLRLQFALPVIGLTGAGLYSLWRRDWRAGMLLSLHLLVNLGFTMNTVQDVMAYMMIPFTVLALLAGVGARLMIEYISRIGEAIQNQSVKNAFQITLIPAILIWPVLTFFQNFTIVSLRDYRAADDYVDSVFDFFEGKNQNAVLLSDWEHMTPLWFRQHIHGEALEPSDVLPIYVVGSSPTLWVDKVWENIEVGPIYLIEYRPDIVEAGFRLRSEGSFYRVLAPPAKELPLLANTIDEKAGPIEWLGYEVQAESTVQPGSRIPVLLAFRTLEPVDDIIQPYAVLGAYTQRWTTDSHWLSPWWQPGEIIVERWEVVVPLDASAGAYSLAIGLTNLISGEDLQWSDTAPLREIAVLNVSAAPYPNAELLANFGQRVGLAGARAWSLEWQAEAPWPDPQPIQPGEQVEIRLDWQALATPEDSLTVFVHLLDLANGLWASKDFTPLGGAFPTQLWFPKWLPEQQVTDPYRIRVPAEIPPGDYLLEVGLYGLRSIMRVSNYDSVGNLAGDRYVLGALRVAGE